MNNGNINVLKSKVCKKCKEKKVLNKNNFHVVKGNKDGFHGTCKVCRSEQQKVADKRRRRESKHLIHELTCKQCENNFMASVKTRSFCSSDCMHEYNRTNNLQSKQQKEYARITLLNREKTFEEKFNARFEGMFKYHSQYTHADKRFNCECLKCGSVIERNAKVIRSNRTPRCPRCHKIELEKNRLVREREEKRNKEVLSLIRQAKNKLNAMVREINKKIKEEFNYYLFICDCCGELYKVKRKGRKYCSNRCSDRMKERTRDRRTRKLRVGCDELGEITLEKLIKRDDNTCHICNDLCDESDREITDEGHFIVGKNYPSVDHVHPLSKGGFHSWENVKLAHHYCNTIKKDKIS